MATSQLSPEQIIQISGVVAAFITAQRDRFLPYASPLNSVQRTAMDGFFPSSLLDGVRTIVLDGTRIENPAFYQSLGEIGFSDLPDFSQMAAVTFSDTVVSHEAFADGLLFHELVHVQQYHELGIPRFAERYVRGFVSGGGYEGVPLERNAYQLGDRFELSPKVRFSVAEEVSRWIFEGRF